VVRIGAPAVEFHQASIDTNTELTSGMVRLLGTWKPEGTPELEKGDLLQAAFLRMDVVPVK